MIRSCRVLFRRSLSSAAIPNVNPVISSGDQSLLTAVQKDLKSAMISRDQMKSQTLKSILSELKYAMKSNSSSANKPPALADEIEIIQRMIKKRQQSIDQFQQANRTDLVSTETAQLEIVKSYLPPQMSREELLEYVRGVCEKLGASGPKDMSRVVKETRETIKAGSASASFVAQIVGEVLRGGK